MQKIGYLVIILLIGILVYIKYPRKINKTINQEIGNQSFSLELANNSYLQAKGLSGRDHLCPECGMLFVFSRETTQTFWMKNTLIPLDIIFINSNNQITDIYTASPQPGKSDFQLTLYQSTAPSIYVIELNAGLAQKLNLKPGDKIDLNL
ncbi:MAG: hypothetical protein US68_C0009G0020 [Candidatus Shapirobacteria bacterium GW2011_GWE1_38_10]|uniref:DUF192 domain-containing protein n=1 Tax=Candidatus Shapirobacteria bacterium GW2011_GWE1_38_10 TaxID=1618488 RepID=A0A0G0IGB5_9BACT|nr:MAG: hypothetical protein US46_C0002G0038 [Candidatus Shapirobacteria bacterium GW2011_GWF2_37_20]KKQ50065.1 MAG: hypothetical protein US68_C0009G0020 [Candidatus Shapirobacteria bacterium GW2011_GWE1_38_10]HBP51137.1 hypothetical protein [Candidatus Shapirobacteria bacterium]